MRQNLSSSQIHSLLLGNIVDSGIGLSYRPASLFVARRTSTSTLCRSQLYPPSQELRIWLQDGADKRKIVHRSQTRPWVCPKGFLSMAFLAFYWSFTTILVWVLSSYIVPYYKQQKISLLVKYQGMAWHCGYMPDSRGVRFSAEHRRETFHELVYITKIYKKYWPS